MEKIEGRVSSNEVNERPTVTRSKYYFNWVITHGVNHSNYIHSNVWSEITYPFPHFKGLTTEVWEWISNVIPHFTELAIIYPRRG